MHTFSRTNPYRSRVRSRSLLTKEGSSKNTFLVSLEIDPALFQYSVGDSIGVLPHNDKKDVEFVLRALSLSDDQSVFLSAKNTTLSAYEYLLRHANLQRITPQLRAWIDKPSEDHDVVSYLSLYPKPFIGGNLSDFFAPLLPRLYSIASSQQVHPTEIRLVIATFSYPFQNRIKRGVASSYLSFDEGEYVDIYLQRSPHFTLPQDPTTPIIMIGPGTGIAPFIGFLEERALFPESGENWLFFGERNRATDFFFEEFLLSHPNLILRTAFSRDFSQKEYVQHKLLEEAACIGSLLDKGANIYICGDASSMAHDVQKAIQTIIEEQKGVCSTTAQALLKQLKKERRLLLDVY